MVFQPDNKLEIENFVYVNKIQAIEAIKTFKLHQLKKWHMGCS